jgi:hypothetical protein
MDIIKQSSNFFANLLYSIPYHEHLILAPF